MRLVLADNDPAALDLIATDLRLEGHDVVGLAPDGATALALCREHEPDVLVIDYRMPPGQNGLDVGATVRRELPDVAVVLYTNYQSAELYRRVDDAGMTLVPKGNLRTLRRTIASFSRR